MPRKNRKQNGRPKPKKSKQQQPSPAQAASPSRRKRGSSRGKGVVQSYIDSLYSDVNIPAFGLPSPNYFGPVSANTYRTQFQLSAPAVGGAATVVLNPLLAGFTQVFYEKQANGAIVYGAVPSLFMNDTVAGSGIPTESAGADWVTPLTISNQYAPTNTTGYSGKMRVLGAKFRITYTGPWTNRGGELLCFTNPNSISLLLQDDTGTTGNAYRYTTAFDSNSEIDQANSLYTRVPINDYFEWTWRPTDLSFKDYSTYVPLAESVTAGASNGNPSYFDYLPSTRSGAIVAPKGWITGFQLRPAVYTAGAALPYRCEVEVYTEGTAHRFDVSAGGTTTGADMYPATHHVLPNSADHDRVCSALSHVHAARRHHASSTNHSLAMTVVNKGMPIVRSAAADLAAQGFARIAGSLF